MVSPMRRHQQKVRAIQSGALSPAATGAPPAPDPATAAGQEYAALRVLLHDNLRALSDIASIEARNPKKAEFAKAFAQWIEGVLLAGTLGMASQDEILVTNMVWAVDYRDFDYALTLGQHAIRYGLTLPDRYKRTVACFLAEEIGLIALNSHALVTHEQLLRLFAVIEDQDMPDPVTARLHKALGRSWWRKADAFDPTADNARAGGKAAYLAQALGHTRRAMALDAHVGVKKDLEKMLRQLKEAAPPADDPADTTE